jgi:hypothetical protein
MYNPANWYWIGQPVGQSSAIIYSSASHAVVQPTDAGYVSFLANVGPATPWPQDATGAVTVAALDAVLVNASIPQPPTGITT